MIETVFDTLNAKAAIFGITGYFEAAASDRPMMISGTITDASGRTLSGQTTEAFYTSDHATPARSSSASTAPSAPEAFRDHTYDLSQIADSYTHIYPNAGLPNELGEYDETPETWPACARLRRPTASSTSSAAAAAPTPAHIRAFAEPLRDLPPRPSPPRRPPTLQRPRAAGHHAAANFVNIGERTNVTGSRRFAKLILAGDYEAALTDVARQQVESGAQIIDINMDEGMLDAEAAMVRFLNLIAGEPDIARVPVMLDSPSGASSRPG
jgi:5-methyltetrahydrofolate--homocysteine methyltransferase